MPRGYPTDKPFKRDGSRAQVVLLDSQMRRLAVLETSPVYREMCELADERRKAGGDCSDWWSKFGSVNVEPKQRKAVGS